MVSNWMKPEQIKEKIILYKSYYGKMIQLEKVMDDMWNVELYTTEKVKVKSQTVNTEKEAKKLILSWQKQYK